MINEEAIKILQRLVAHFEGDQLEAYPDPGTGGKPWTIGRGHTGTEVHKGLIWTQKQSDDAFHADCENYLKWAIHASPSLANATPGQQAAIADFCYNCGMGNYKASTLKRYVDVGGWEHAKMEIVKWDHSDGKVLRGLTLRRQAEADLL